MAKSQGKEGKTNAMRLLEQQGFVYEVLTYAATGFQDGVSVAQKLNIPLANTFKTLVTRGKNKEIYVFVIPVEAELDLKKAAKILGEKSLALLPVKEITAVTGYVRGGCSPIGMKKQFPTIVHETAAHSEKIYVSGGRLGAQICCTPATLLQVAGGIFADVIAAK